MRAKAAFLPVLAALLLLGGCGQETKEYDALSVFSVDASRRGGYLTSASDTDLWEELGLSGLTVTQGEYSETTIGEEQWLTVSTTLSGDDAKLYFCQDEHGNWQLDLRASFGVNELPITEWEAQDDILTERVTASLSDELPEQYTPYAATHYAVRLTDYTGENGITAVCTRESSDGDALYTLLSDGKEHRVLLGLRAFSAESGETLWRITRFAENGWLNREAVLRSQCTALLRAVQISDYGKTSELLHAGNAAVTDENGDGLLYYALRDNDADLANLLIGRGCGRDNDNEYWHDMRFLLDFERSDIEALTARLRQQGKDPGCTAESLSHYLVRESNNASLQLYLSAFEPQIDLSPLESANIASRYGLEAEGETANLLDIAVLNNSAAVAQTLLSDGVQSSALLRQKIYLEPTSFSDQMLIVLGKQNYFGVLSEVLNDYRAFRESYNEVAAESVEKFTNSYNQYLDAVIADDTFAARAVMDSSLLSDIVRQLETVQKVQQPGTEAISSLWELMYDYADTMDTAGYYYKRTARTTYVVTRRYFVSMFETRLEEGEELRSRFFAQLTLYDKLLQNTK